MKNAANNLQKMRESSFIPQPIESTTNTTHFNYILYFNAIIQDHKCGELSPHFLGP